MDRGVNRREFLSKAAYTLAGSTVLTKLGIAGAPAPDPPTPGKGDWAGYSYDLRSTRFNANEKTIGKGNVDRLKVKWKFDVKEPIGSTPTVVGDTLFFPGEGVYYALDSQTGKLKWKYEAPQNPKGSARRALEYYKGRLYAGDTAGWVRCVNAANGGLIWERDFSTWTDGPDPTVRTGIRISGACLAFDDKIYFGTTGNKTRVACLNADNGTTAWEYWITGEHNVGKGGAMWNGFALDEKERILYVPTGDDKDASTMDSDLFTECLIAFDADTGYMKWYYQARPNDVFDLDWSCHPMIFDAEAPPMKKGSIRQCVAAGNKDGVYCFDRYSGERLWMTQLTAMYFFGGPNVDSMACAYNKVYVVSNAATQLIGKPPISVTAALDGYTGRIVWWTYNLEGICQGPLAAANGVLYQGFNDGRMEALDADTGKVLWQHTLPTARKGGFAVANGALYVGSGVPGSGLEGGAPGFTPPDMMERARNVGYSMFCFTLDGK